MSHSSGSDAATAFRINELRFGYRKNGPEVLNVPSFHLDRGETLFLHGPSGSGKTTLLGLLAGILSPQSGTVELLGQPFSALPGRRRDQLRGAHLGYIFQMFNLIPYLNVRQNIQLSLGINHQRAARVKDPEAETLRLASHLGISHLLKRPVTELSVGQQQRVAAARALIGSPEVIVADEPTSALDSDHREAFLKILFKEARERQASVLFVSHDLSLAPLFSRVVSLATLNTVALRPAPEGV